MNLTRVVNGVTVAMTPQETAAIEAEWAVNAARPPVVPRKSEVQVLRAALIAKGVLTDDDLQPAARRSP